MPFIIHTAKPTPRIFSFCSQQGFFGDIRTVLSFRYTIIKKFNKTDGLPSIKDIYIFNFNDILLFGTRKGIYVFDTIKQKFIQYKFFDKI